MLGLLFVGDYVVAERMNREMREVALSPLLKSASHWAWQNEVEAVLIILGLAALGGFAWRTQRARGQPWGGVALMLFIVLAPALMVGLIGMAEVYPGRLRDYLDWALEADLLIKVAVLGPVLVWAWVAAHEEEGKEGALKEALWLGRGLLTVVVFGYLLHGSSPGRPLARALFYALPFGVLPAVALMHYRPWRRSVALPAVAVAAGFFLAGGLAMPQINAVTRDVPEKLGPDSLAVDPDVDPVLMSSLMSLGSGWIDYHDAPPRWTAINVTRMRQAEEGVMPDYRGQSAPNLEYDRTNLSAAREYLWERLAADPEPRDASILALATATDPLATEEEVARVMALAEMFPDLPLLRSQLAMIMYTRGETAEGDRLVRLWQGLGPDDPLPREEVDPCGDPQEDDEGDEGGLVTRQMCPSWATRLGRAMFIREWPLFSPPYEGLITVTLDSGAMATLEERLFVAPVPLHHPDEPTHLNNALTHGGLAAEGLASYRPVAAGRAFLGPLPAGRYVLQVGLKAPRSSVAEVWVAGLPSNPIAIGPEGWEAGAEIALLPAEPVIARCEDEVVRWDPYAGAESYRVELWGGPSEPSARHASEIVPGETLGDLEPLLDEPWGIYKWLRVIPLDGEGAALVEALPLSVAAKAAARERGTQIAEACLPGRLNFRGALVPEP
ncbi:hypothetical protein IIA16_04790 [bacterium]|nr:hypothetical protein [bacterium]